MKWKLKKRCFFFLAKHASATAERRVLSRFVDFRSLKLWKLIVTYEKIIWFGWENCNKSYYILENELLKSSFQSFRITSKKHSKSNRNIPLITQSSSLVFSYHYRFHDAVNVLKTLKKIFHGSLINKNRRKRAEEKSGNIAQRFSQTRDDCNWKS